MAAEIYEFIDARGEIDFDAWRGDLCGRFLTEYIGFVNGVSTRELCRLYFGSDDLERKLLVGQEMQIVRGMLQERGILLHNRFNRWYAVAPDDTGGARGFIVNRAKRIVRAHVRLRQASSIGQSTYALPATDPIVLAIEGASPAVAQLENAASLPSPDEPDPN